MELWKPQKGPQERAIAGTMIPELFFGGAAAAVLERSEVSILFVAS